MAADDVRTELMKALQAAWQSIYGEHRRWNLDDHFADALLPVVDRMVREAALRARAEERQALLAFLDRVYTLARAEAADGGEGR